MIQHMALGFIAGVCFMLVLSALDVTLTRRAARKRFDAEVNRVLERDLTYRSSRD
jgi:hypothetical protein